MRLSAIVCVLIGLLGCAATPTTTPREYLDEQTAATIKVVADPLIFVTDSPGGRDYLNVYAIDVNRMGEHRQYLAVFQWWPPAGQLSAATLELQAAGDTILLEATSASARELGIAQQIDPSTPKDGRWHYFPANKGVFDTLARSSDIRAMLISGEQRLAYALWRDGRAELTNLAAEIP